MVGGEIFLSSGGLGWGEEITREDITEKLGKCAIPDRIWGNFVKKQLPDNFVVGGGAQGSSVSRAYDRFAHLPLSLFPLLAREIRASGRGAENPPIERGELREQGD